MSCIRVFRIRLICILTAALTLLALAVPVMFPALGPVAYAGGTSKLSVEISVTAPVESLSLEDALFLSAMAAFFGMDVHMVAQYYGYGYGPSGIQVVPAPVPVPVITTPTSLLTVFYISSYSRTEPSDIILLREKRHGWGRIAKDRGVPSNFHGKVAAFFASKQKAYVQPSDAEFERTTYIYFASSYYGVSQSQVSAWLNMGIPAPELTVCLNLAARARVNPGTVIQLRRSGMSWDGIARRYHVSRDDLRRPVPPKSKFKKK